tara:strand:- start:1326 stop:1625 length:300 start_codon:yes stop_codon:yes gene_type:complete
MSNHPNLDNYRYDLRRIRMIVRDRLGEHIRLAPKGLDLGSCPAWNARRWRFYVTADKHHTFIASALLDLDHGAFIDNNTDEIEQFIITAQRAILMPVKA